MKKPTVYLIAYYYMRPKFKHVKTQEKGWMKTENALAYDEQVTVARNLKMADKTMAKIILDLGNKKVYKNGWGTNDAFDDLFKYFMSSYPKYTTEIMKQLDEDYLIKMSEPAPTVSITKPTGEIQVVDTSLDMLPTVTITKPVEEVQIVDTSYASAT